MREITIKLLCLSFTICALSFSPVKAVDTNVIVDAIDESVLENNVDLGRYLALVQDKDVELLNNNSKELESHISNLESDVQTVISKINSIEGELKSLEISEKDLEKYSSTAKIDVAEKEFYEGIGYDKDIFDHGKELADNDTLDFYSKYLHL